MEKIDEVNKDRVQKMRSLLARESTLDACEAATIGRSMLHDTIGGSHPLMTQLGEAIESTDFSKLMAAGKGAIELFERGMLVSPRLSIAGEIEGEILDIAQTQVQAWEATSDANTKALQLAVAAFLAGAAIEDALRRLCSAHQIAYDANKATISKLQSLLYKPNSNIEFISASENKHITAWGDTRNKADHGHFAEITHTETLTMIMGIRSFIEKHLP